MNAVEIEPLLSQIDQLASHFGRVTGDLQAIAARGRAEDFKGVMQNTRLVLEAILRDLVTRELKQTVGKAMLDELITKFRQQANAGIIPTNILAHMGTVQAWGNLSAHDHAGSLSDEGVKVGREEVVASLNSMVAILNWYAGKLGLTPAAGRPATKPPAQGELAAPVPVKSNTVPIVLGGVVLLGSLAGGYWYTSRPSAPLPMPVDRFAAVDAAYRSRGEPVPPMTCRDPGEAATLGSATGEAALSGLSSPEAGYLLARVRYEAGGVPGPELQRAASCAGFAAALSLAGKTEVREAEAAAKRGEAEAAAALYAKAEKHFDAAIAASPGFKNVRFNRALVLLKRNKIDDGVRALGELVTADPGFSEAHFYLGVALEAQARGDAAIKQRAKDEFCTAFKQGIAIAKTRCEATE